MMKFCVWSPFCDWKRDELLCGARSIFHVTHYSPSVPCVLFSSGISFPSCLSPGFSPADPAHPDGDLDAAAPAPDPAPHLRVPDGAPERGGAPSPGRGHALHCQGWGAKSEHPQRSQLWLSKYEHTFLCCSDSISLLELPSVLPRVSRPW